MVIFFCLSVNCKFHNTQLSKYSNGQTKEKYSILKDKNGNVVRDGKYFLFFDNGKIKEQGKYLNGNLVGIRKCFYENGQNKSEENYNDRGLPDGIQTEWYKNGKIQSQTSVKQDVAQMQYKQWYPNGNIKMVVPLSNNIWNGHVLFFTENGDTAIDLLCTNGKVSKINRLLPAWENVLLDYAAKNMVEYSISRVLNVSFARNYINQVDLYSKQQHIPDSMARSGISVYYSTNLPQNISEFFKRYESEFFYNGTYNGSIVSACKAVLPVLFFISYNNESQRIQIYYYINWDVSKNNRDFYYEKGYPNFISPSFYRAIQIGVRVATPYFHRSAKMVDKFNGIYLTSITDFECVYRKPNDDYIIVSMDFGMKPNYYTVSVAPYQPQTFRCVPTHNSYDCRLWNPYTASGALSNNALPFIFFGAIKPK